MVGNDHVLRLRSRVAVKLNFRPYIGPNTSPNENFLSSFPLIGTQVCVVVFFFFFLVLINSSEKNETYARSNLASPHIVLTR